MEKKWDTVIPADLKRLFVSGTYMSRWHDRVKVMFSKERRCVTEVVKQLCLPAYSSYLYQNLPFMTN
jgi:hypothetical protein